MRISERVIPDLVFEWSLHFKLGVVGLGAVFLFSAAIIRPDVSVLIWGPLFLIGALIECVIVALVYLEMKKLEGEIEEMYAEIKKAEKEILAARDKTEVTWQRLQGLANETYDLQGSTDEFRSLEPGGHMPPEQVDVGSYEEPLEERLRELERKVEKMDRDTF